MKLTVEMAKVIAELWFRTNVNGTAHAAAQILLGYKTQSPEFDEVEYDETLKYLVENGHETEEHLFNRLCYDFVWDEEDRLKELLNKSGARLEAILKHVKLLNSLSTEALNILHEQAVNTKAKQIVDLWAEYYALVHQQFDWISKLRKIQRQKKSANKAKIMNDNELFIRIRP